MIGLVLAVTPPRGQVAPSCDHPANYALRVRWPDQILPNYAHEWYFFSSFLDRVFESSKYYFIYNFIQSAFHATPCPLFAFLY